MIKGIIFDLDGTLLDTSEDIRQTLNSSLEKFNLAQVSIKQTISFIGDGAKNLVYRAVGESNQDIAPLVYEDYMVNFARSQNANTRLFSDEQNALEAFAKKGVKMAILTNKPQKATENVYNKYLSGFGFCVVLGQTEKYPLKPAPDSALAVLAEMGISKDECLYVGDGDADIVCANNAGLSCVSVLWGYRTREQLLAAGATRLVSSFEELQNLVLNS